MRQSWLLLGFVLAVGVVAGGTGYAAAADPLDGKVFLSVEKLTGGDHPDGTVSLIHWKIRFKDKSFTWLHTDVVSAGTYEFDDKTGAVVITGSGLQASLDARTGVLTWDGHKYEEVKAEK
jgi:hypothetical protein